LKYAKLMELYLLSGGATARGGAGGEGAVASDVRATEGG